MLETDDICLIDMITSNFDNVYSPRHFLEKKYFSVLWLPKSSSHRSYFSHFPEDTAAELHHNFKVWIWICARSMQQITSFGFWILRGRSICHNYWVRYCILPHGWVLLQYSCLLISQIYLNNPRSFPAVSTSCLCRWPRMRSAMIIDRLVPVSPRVQQQSVAKLYTL